MSSYQERVKKELQTLLKNDLDLFDAVEQERIRQEEHIELIASENYTSNAIMALQGSLLTNKYAEGYPAKRYYGGCEFVDKVESLAIDRAKSLFNADYANVQPHSGSQANGAVFLALLQPGDRVLGLSMDSGGHLTHGAKVNFSGKTYESYGYSVNEEGKLDYQAIEKQALELQPKLIIAGMSAYSGVIDWKKFREIADKVGAYLLVDMAHIAGLVAAGVYPSPIEHAHVVTSTTHKTLAGPRGGLILAKNQSEELYKKLNSAVFPGIQGGPLMHVIAAKASCFLEAASAEFATYQKNVVLNAQMMAKVLQERGYDIVSKGTYNHMMLIDLRAQDLTGKDACVVLEEANITTNKNGVPFDTKSPFVTSGIRVGTAAITRRGFDEQDAKQVALWIADLLDAMQKTPETLAAVQKTVKEAVCVLCASKPVYHTEK